MIPMAFVPLVTHLWQSTLFAAVAGLLTLALKRNQARVRYWLWLAASCKFLLPFSWLVSIGHRFEWSTAPAVMAPAVSALTEAVSGPIFLSSFPAAKPAPVHLPVFLFAIWAIWACGFVAVVAGWTREWLRIRAIVCTASPLPLGLPIRSASTSARLEPGVFGIFRPVLILPEGIAARLTQAQLRAVLAHELSHVRRRDNLTAMIHMLVEAIFWFYPLLWWLGARMIDERERACDEEVLQSGSHAQAYAESILKVCEFYLESPLTCMSGVTGSDLKKRIQRIMKQHLGVALSARKKLLLATAALAALAVPIVAGALMAQSAGIPAWQAAAGGKMSFDVTSVKQNNSGLPRQMGGVGDPVDSNLQMDAGDAYAPNGGLFRATNAGLLFYINFAYKVDPNQFQSLTSQLPKWASTDRFNIEARAKGNPTKDQMRLMVQSLLADRFKLAIHYETRQLPVLALVLDKPGKLGPQLHAHSDDPPCAPAIPHPPGSAPAKVAGGYPAVCGALIGGPASGRMHLSGRNMPLELIGSDLGSIGQVGRPVLDQTGLKGNFDFIIDWTPESNGPRPPGADVASNTSGPTLLEALREQLGLKLEPRTGPVDLLVIDHIEQPSPN